MKIKRAFAILLLTMSLAASAASAQIDPGNKCLVAKACAGSDDSSSMIVMSEESSFSWGMSMSSVNWSQTGGR